MTPLISVDKPARRIARITLNLPEKRNALAPELRDDLRIALDAQLHDAETRVVIITGAGGTFCSGGDISGFDAAGANWGRSRLKKGHDLVRAIMAADKPVVAAVEGYAMGAGAGLAMACDTVVVDEKSTIGFPFLKVGLGPDFGVLFTFTHRVGPASARHAFLHAKNFKGREAVACGLADELADAGQVQERALAAADNLASLPPLALAMTKRQFALAAGNFEYLAELEAMGQSLCFNGSELQEGIAAFREKRQPDF